MRVTVIIFLAVSSTPVAVYFARGLGVDSPKESAEYRMTDEPNGSVLEPAIVSSPRTRFGSDIAEVPFGIERHSPRIRIARDDRSIHDAATKIWPQYGDSIAVLIHALHALHKAPALQPLGRPSVDEMSAVLLDSSAGKSWYEQGFPIMRTRYGLRFVTPLVPELAGQAHTDQVLTILGEMGIDSRRQVVVPDGKGEILDLLVDATANFQLRGEFEWSAMARILYSPKSASWKNRFGEDFTFDDVAEALITKPLTESSCGGIHAIHALAVLRQVDCTYHVLQPSTRSKVRSVLKHLSSFVESQQLVDGSIDPHWNYHIRSQEWYINAMQSAGGLPLGQSSNNISAIPDELHLILRDKVLATSHHIEWLTCLPPDELPTDTFFIRANGFLARALMSADEALIEQDYCPYSHAFAVLLTLSDE